MPELSASKLKSIVGDADKSKLQSDKTLASIAFNIPQLDSNLIREMTGINRLQINKTFAALSKNIFDSIDMSIFSNLAKEIEEKDAKYNKAYKKNAKKIKQIADKCWFFPFLDFGLDEQEELLDIFKNTSIDKLEISFKSFFRSKQKEIEQYIIKEYPSLTKLCSEVFFAHYNKKYYLSVPMFFTLVDSITNLSVVNAPYFFKSEYCQNAKGISKKSNSSYKKNFYNLLVRDLYIGLHENARKNHEISNSLNRHIVMHGLLNEYDWGNETDSLKAMSLAYFIASLFDNKEKE